VVIDICFEIPLGGSQSTKGTVVGDAVTRYVCGLCLWFRSSSPIHLFCPSLCSHHLSLPSHSLCCSLGIVSSVMLMFLLPVSLRHDIGMGNTMCIQKWVCLDMGMVTGLAYPGNTISFSIVLWVFRGYASTGISVR